MEAPPIQAFLREHEDADERALVLKQREILGVPTKLIAQQLAGRRKAREKLPSWYKADGIIYPPTISLEQCSSEATAKLKQHLFTEFVTAPQRCADLTGGLGVDSYYLSHYFPMTEYVEPNEELFTIACHNHKILGVSINHYLSTAEDFLKSNTDAFDLIFLDPSRRDTNSRKVVKLTDCVPNVVGMQTALLKISQYFAVKTSPLLDIQQGLRELIHVKRVVVVAVQNECKEILFLLEREYGGNPVLEAIDLSSSGSILFRFTFALAEEKDAGVHFSEPLRYLYEPSAALMKSGAYKLIGQRWNLLKLAPNTHLYTSNHLVERFQGRVFEILKRNPSVDAIHELTGGYANITTRNYPVHSEDLRKQLRLKDGGSHYIIGFSSQETKHLVLCTRLTGNR